MDADKDNPNPTIVNASDLPSRRRSNPTAKRPTLFDSLIAPAYPSYAVPLDDLSSPEASDNASDDEEDTPREEIDAQEIYDLISSIQDPEHPNSLASLAVVNLPDISISPRTQQFASCARKPPRASACAIDRHVGSNRRWKLVVCFASPCVWTRSERLPCGR